MRRSKRSRITVRVAALMAVLGCTAWMLPSTAGETDWRQSWDASLAGQAIRNLTSAAAPRVAQGAHRAARRS